MTAPTTIDGESPPPVSWVTIVCGVAAAVVWAWLGPATVRELKPGPGILNDFFQDWASARFVMDGRSPYSPQVDAVRDYLGGVPTKRHRRDPFNEVNAHPPTAVLLLLPLAKLDYPTACLIWNLLSLATVPISVWILMRQLDLPFRPAVVLAVLAVLPLCGPLREQIVYGQLNLLLLLLVIGGWALARSGHPWGAGATLALACALKLFPAYLFLFFLFCGRWKVVLSGAVASALLATITAAVMGADAYRDYLAKALPALDMYRSSWVNLSLAGFWARLFYSPAGYAACLFDSAGIALAATIVTSAVLILLNILAIRRAVGQDSNPDKQCQDRNPDPRGAATKTQQDRAFALSLIAMLLVSPLSWPHYLLLLALPVVLLIRDVPHEGGGRAVLFVSLALLWMPFAWMLFALRMPPNAPFVETAFPAQSILFLALRTYALIALFVLQWQSIRRSTGDDNAKAAQ